VALRGRERIVVVTYALALALQWLGVLSGERGAGSGPGIGSVAFGYDFRVLSTTLVGVRAAAGLVTSGKADITWLALATAALLLAALLVNRRGRLLLLVTVVTSVTFWLISCYGARGDGGGFPPPGGGALDLTVGGRYTILPGLLLFTGLVVAFDGFAQRVRAVPARIALVALALAPVVVWTVTGYRPVPGLRTAAPAWSGSVAQFRASCAADPATPPAYLTIEPGGAWGVQLTCAEVLK
jgi:hypothetical protein